MDQATIATAIATHTELFEYHLANSVTAGKNGSPDSQDSQWKQAALHATILTELRAKWRETCD